MHIVDGLLRAIDHTVAFIELSQRSEDRMAVVDVLPQPPFSFMEIQAEHILDRTIAGFSPTARDKLLEEAAQLPAPSRRAP